MKILATDRAEVIPVPSVKANLKELSDFQDPPKLNDYQLLL